MSEGVCDACAASGECQWCEGEGVLDDPDDECPHCDGSGNCEDCNGKGAI